MHLLDLASQDGAFCHAAVDNGIGRLINTPNLQNVDTLAGGGADGNKLAANIFASPHEFVALQRCRNHDLRTLAAHPQCHQLQRKGLACTGCTEDSHVCILVCAGVEDVYEQLFPPSQSMYK